MNNIASQRVDRSGECRDNNSYLATTLSELKQKLPAGSIGGIRPEIGTSSEHRTVKNTFISRAPSADPLPVTTLASSGLTGSKSEHSHLTTEMLFAAVDRITNSRSFEGADRLKRFLRFVVS